MFFSPGLGEGLFSFFPGFGVGEVSGVVFSSRVGGGVVFFFSRFWGGGGGAGAWSFFSPGLGEGLFSFSFFSGFWGG